MLGLHQIPCPLPISLWTLFFSLTAIIIGSQTQKEEPRVGQENSLITKVEKGLISHKMLASLTALCLHIPTYY